MCHRRIRKHCGKRCLSFCVWVCVSSKKSVSRGTLETGDGTGRPTLRSSLKAGVGPRPVDREPEPGAGQSGGGWCNFCSREAKWHRPATSWMDPGRGEALGEVAAARAGGALSECVGVTADMVGQTELLWDSENRVNCLLQQLGLFQGLNTTPCSPHTEHAVLLLLPAALSGW